MSKKLHFLPCLPWDLAALEAWANSLAREGRELRRISRALPFLALSAEGPGGSYTLVEPRKAAQGAGCCRVPWVYACVAPGRRAGKYPMGGARRRALNLLAGMALIVYAALVLTTGDTARGLAWLFGEGELSAVSGLLSALNGVFALVSALSVLICLILTVRVKYNRACLAAFALSFVSLWLWLILRAVMLIHSPI